MQELQFQMAVRDQVIAEQRNVINNIFQIVEGAGLSKEDIQEIARERGIVVEGLDGADPKRLKEQQVKGVSKFTFTWAGRRAKARYDFWKGQGAGLGGLLKTIGKTFMGGGGAIVPGN